MDWKSLFIGVAGSVIAAALVYGFARSNSWISIALGKLSKSYLLNKRLKEAGLNNFYLSRIDYVKFRGAPRLIDYLSTANETIQVAAYWMAHGNEAEGIAEDIANLILAPKSLKITIAIINPRAPYIAELASYLGVDETELVMRIKSTLKNLSEARENLPHNLKDFFKLKVYNTIPIASVIILDGKSKNGRIQIDLKPYKVSRNESFSFEFKGNGNPIYDLCCKAWSQLIDDSQDFEINRHL